MKEFAIGMGLRERVRLAPMMDAQTMFRREDSVEDIVSSPELVISC